MVPGKFVSIVEVGFKGPKVTKIFSKKYGKNAQVKFTLKSYFFLQNSQKRHREYQTRAAEN